MLDLIAIFTTVFLAELGDKTQLATVLFASNGRQHPALVFAAAAGALCLSTALAVVISNVTGQYLTRVPLKLITGLAFIAIGMWTLYGHFQAG